MDIDAIFSSFIIFLSTLNEYSEFDTLAENLRFAP